MTGPHRSLGLWSAEARTYPEAAEALARRVGRAAGLGPGMRALELGCGAGGAFATWLEGFGVAEVVGLEPDPALYDAARRGAASLDGVSVVRAPAEAAADLGGARFDAALAVDAAYHFDADRWPVAAAGRLGEGARLAFTDLVRVREGAAAGYAVRAAARLCRLGPGAPGTQDGLRQRLSRAGLELQSIEDLTAPVLGGFADWVARGAEGGPPVSRVALEITARLARWARDSGAVRYVLVVAQMRSATALEATTAASSSGKPSVR